MKRLFRVSVLLVIAVLACSGVVFLHEQVISIRENIASRQQKIDMAPQELRHTSLLKKELVEADSRVAFLKDMVVQKDALADVVAAISDAAVKSGVSAQVPQVGQSIAKGQAKNTQQPLLEDVRIHVSASGDPVALIQFLYRIEQLPYLLRVASWTIDTTRQVIVSSLVGIASPAPGSDNSFRGSSLEADVIIVTVK